MNPQALRKAAILVNSLDTAGADALLEQMGDEVAAQVRNAVMNLDDVSEDEQQDVIAEFVRRQRGGSAEVETADDNVAVEIEDSLATRLREPIQESPTGSPAPPRRHFDFLETANLPALSAHLQREHPQIIAVVLAHMPPSHAANVITRFGQSLRVEVIQRMAEMGETNPELVHEIECELAVVVSGRISNRDRSAGVVAVNAILQAVGDNDRSQLLAGLTDRAPEVANLVRAEQFASDVDWPPAATHFATERETTTPAAAPATPNSADPEPSLASRQPRADDDFEAGDEEPDVAEPAASSAVRRDGLLSVDGPPPTDRQPPLIDFGQLHLLEDQALARVLREADAQIRLVALAGAKRDLVDRLLKPLRPKDRRAFEKKLQSLGPIRLQDIAYAQQRLADVANQLAQRGVISLPQFDRFNAAA
ncbi:MAG: FliG C-terminal domain-containing protein [Pirellulaceae bacterium]|jgi:flagellar motor switch protein FliG|nr:FliG C-terminal domain-containing protein [Pirellulaceae bacterium]